MSEENEENSQHLSSALVPSSHPLLSPASRSASCELDYEELDAAERWLNRWKDSFIRHWASRTCPWNKWPQRIQTTRRALQHVIVDAARCADNGKPQGAPVDQWCGLLLTAEQFLSDNPAAGQAELEEEIDEYFY
jgi:hypothetical protein